MTAQEDGRIRERRFWDVGLEHVYAVCLMLCLRNQQITYSPFWHDALFAGARLIITENE